MTDTYQDLQNAIVRELNNRSDLTTEIQAAILSAVYHYQRKKFWFSEEIATITTADGTDSYDFSTDFGYIGGATVIYSTYPVPIMRRDMQTMRELYFNTTILKGPPTDFAVYENKLWLWPTPNGAYTVTLYQNFKNAAPSAGTDSNVWTTGTEAEELIRARAVADIKTHVLKQTPAMLEFAQYAPLGFLCGREKIAYDMLMEETANRISSGRIKPIDF